MLTSVAPQSVAYTFLRGAVIATIGFVVAACATQPPISTFTDPAYRGQAPKAARMAIVGVDMSLMEQRALEAKGVEMFDKYGIPSLRGQNVLAPTQTYTKEQAQAALRDAGAELMLEITALDRQRGDGYGRSGLSLGFGYGRGYGYHGTSVHARHHLGGRYGGGYGYDDADVTYRARLIDLSNGAVMWQGDANIRGSGTRYEYHAKRMAEVTINALVRDGMILGSGPVSSSGY